MLEPLHFSLEIHPGFYISSFEKERLAPPDAQCGMDLRLTPGMYVRWIRKPATTGNSEVGGSRSD